MKKWTAVLLGTILLLGITACGNEKDAGGNAANANNAGQAAKTENAAANTKTDGVVPTVDELIKKSSEASEDLKSFTTEANINQLIKMDNQEQKVDMNMKIDLVREPLAMYQEVKMSMGDQGSQDVKQYITDQGIYSSVGGAWTKLPDETRDQMIASLEQSANPSKQLEQFKSIAKDSKVTAEGDDYVLTADLSGDGLKELASSLMSQAGGDAQSAALLEQMNIKNIKLTYAVNKDTYLPTKSDVDMVMEMAQDGQSISMDMKMDSKISNHNKVAPIQVPQEALDSAQ